MARTVGGGGGSFGGILSGADLQLASDKAILWSSTTDASGPKDTGLARASANWLKVTDGSTDFGTLAARSVRAINGATGGFAISPTTDPTATPDVVLQRAASGVLAVFSDLGTTYGQIKLGANATLAKTGSALTVLADNGFVASFYADGFFSGSTAGSANARCCFNQGSQAGRGRVLDGGAANYADFEADHLIFAQGTWNSPTIDCGLQRLAAGVVKVTNGSTGYGTLGAAALQVVSSGSINFSSTAAPNGAADVGLARLSANHLKITDGASNLSNLTCGAINQTVQNQNALTTTPTWDDGGTYIGWRMTLTDTLSNALSRLIKITVGGTSRFEVDKTGAILGLKLPTTTVTGTYTATVSDHTILCDTSGGGFTVTLPAASSAAGLVLVIKKTSSDANTLTIDGSGAETIDGSATQTTAVQYASFTIQSNGTAWSIL